MTLIHDISPAFSLYNKTGAALTFTADATPSFGAQTRNRTKDTGIFSPLLYQLSYLGKLLIYNFVVGHQGLEPRTCRL